ncbi:hypothetical protein MSG28_003069 [Choristoneura fumiferana]|uniref:Uncharacterized protein n=1 Tax=Choristoneura fumiferana TaxID=7141 RepID=A0ACC0JKL0_CHOFU|nr:hypothetical protein MSG28_003069 [Choristoneura fumiferana]
MKLIIYSVVYCCLVLGLFFTFVYLMTVLDPGLVELADRAAAMVRADRGEAEPEPPDTTLLARCASPYEISDRVKKLVNANGFVRCWLSRANLTWPLCMGPKPPSTLLLKSEFQAHSNNKWVKFQQISHRGDGLICSLRRKNERAPMTLT